MFVEKLLIVENYTLNILLKKKKKKTTKTGLSYLSLNFSLLYFQEKKKSTKNQIS